MLETPHIIHSLNYTYTVQHTCRQAGISTHTSFTQHKHTYHLMQQAARLFNTKQFIHKINK